MQNSVMRNSSRQTRIVLRSVLTAVAAMLITVPALLLNGAPLVQSTLITFEDLAQGTTVTTQYGTKGVVFAGGTVGADLGARSGTRALRSIPFAGEFFDPVPFPLSFPDPHSQVTRVSLFVNSPNEVRNGTFQAFDANDNVVAQDGPKQVAANVFTTKFEVKTNGTPIKRAVFKLENGILYAIDDIEFDGSQAGPPPPPPVVVITSPPNGAALDNQSVTIMGTVTGEGLLSSVNAAIEFGRPPEQQTAPPFTSVLPLVGTGTTRQFSLPGGYSPPMGPIKITITAENFLGGKGSANTTFTNLPLAIRLRAAQQGASLGAFQFGVVGTGCKTAVYQNAAISAQGNVNQTFLIRGEILAKWLAHRELLGCPIGEARNRVRFDNYNGSNWCIFISGNEGPCSALDVPGVVQNFTGGRIYSTAGMGTFYTPAVFVEAIDKRGGEAVTGVPLSDPTSSAGPMRTWLFQRFAVPEMPRRLPSTLEIRGTPPRLYMERQSGPLIDPSTNETLETTATIWEHFPCDPNNPSLCTIDPTPPQPPPIPDVGDKFCFGSSLTGTFENAGVGPRAWEPVLGRTGATQLGLPVGLRPIDPGNFISTPLFGVVTWAKIADADLSVVHEWCYSSLHVPDIDLGIGLFTVPLASPDSVACVSDWLFRVRPYGAHTGTAPFGSLYGGTENKTTIKVEYERFYGDFVVWMGLPRKGDLIFTAGRWVIDCAHETYKTELHPISMFAKMKTVTTLTDPFTGILKTHPFGGTTDNPNPATQADIWVNGWYPGDPIEFDLYPPPRPNADAVLVVNKPVDSQAAFGLTFESKLEPAVGPTTRVHVRLSAPLRQNPVTYLGEMKWQSGRGYEGQWYLYWSQ